MTARRPATVTGGSGFVGASVVDALVAAGHRVRVIDPRPPARDDVEWLPVDVLDHDAVTEALDGSGPVFHLAAMADVNDVVEQPARGHRDQRGGDRERPRGRPARRRRPRHPVQHGLGVRGDPGRRVDETTLFDLETDRHLYVSEKIAAEMFCRDYLTLFHRPYTILRYGIPFGPRMRATSVLASFFLRALAGEPLRIDGDGSQERRFVYVEDLAAPTSSR